MNHKKISGFSPRVNKKKVTKKNGDLEMMTHKAGFTPYSPPRITYGYNMSPTSPPTATYGSRMTPCILWPVVTPESNTYFVQAKTHYILHELSDHNALPVDSVAPSLETTGSIFNDKMIRRSARHQH